MSVEEWLLAGAMLGGAFVLVIGMFAAFARFSGIGKRRALARPVVARTLGLAVRQEWLYSFPYFEGRRAGATVSIEMMPSETESSTVVCWSGLELHQPAFSLDESHVLDGAAAAWALELKEACGEPFGLSYWPASGASPARLQLRIRGFLIDKPDGATRLPRVVTIVERLSEIQGARLPPAG